MFQGFIDAAEENQSDKPMHSEEPPEMNLFNQDLFANEATSKNANKFDFKLPSNDSALFGTISNSDAPLEPKSETPPQTLNAPIFGNSSLFEVNFCLFLSKFLCSRTKHGPQNSAPFQVEVAYLASIGIIYVLVQRLKSFPSKLKQHHKEEELLNWH